MARLITSGFETGIFSATANYHGESNVAVASQLIQNGGAPGVETSVVRSGARSASCAQGSAVYVSLTGFPTTLDRAYYLRFYARFTDASPAAFADIAQVLANGATKVTVRLNTTGTVQLRDSVGNVGSASAALSDNTWYRFEVRFVVPTAGTGTMELRIDGSTIATTATANTGNSVAAAIGIRVGNAAGGTGGVTTYVDDLALNDDTGSDQTSWPGAGSIVLLKPTSVNARGNWVGPQTTGDDTTNLEDNVDNIPPTGVAHSDVDANAGKYVFNITNAANENFDVNCQDYTAAGIATYDTITLVQALARMSVSTTTGTNTGAVAGVSNPSISAVTGFDLETTAVAGTEATGWKSFRTLPSYAPSVTKGTSPVVRATKEVASVNPTMADLMGLLVEYVVVPATVYTDGGTGTIVISGTSTESMITPVIYSDGGTGTVTIAGTSTESLIVSYRDGGTGTVLLVGTTTYPPRPIHVAAPRWLAASVELPGRTITFGPDEDAERMPYDMTFETQLPGGHGSGSMVLPRPDGFDPLDIPLRAPVRFYGPGNRTAYEGRVAAKPRFGVDEITVECEGFSAVLDDNIHRALYVSRDLSKWIGPALQRKIDLIDLGIPSPHQSDASSSPDSTEGPGLRLAVQGAWTTSLPRCEAWRDAGAGLAIAKVTAAWAGWNDTDFQLIVSGADDDTGLVDPDTGTDVYTLALGDFDRDFSGAKRWIWIEWLFNAAPGGVEGDEYGVNLYDLAVYGDHGLTLHDTADEGPQGVRGDDVLRHALALSCPDLDLGDIEQASFIIPDLVYDGWDTRPRNVVEDVTRLGGATDVPNDWGCWGRSFFWRTPGSFGRTHRVRLDEGVTFVDEGEDTGESGTAMIATYTDANGDTKAVGYPGSGADTESELLIDDDPFNPIVRSGTPKILTTDVGKTSPEGATILGALALSEAVRRSRAGAYAIPSLPGDQPPFYLRAGDKLVVEDDFALEQSVTATTYNHGTGLVEAHVGGIPRRLPTYLAQLAQGTG